MSLIRDGIQAMGDPNFKEPTASKSKPVKSIGVWDSIKDWWAVPKSLQKPTIKAIKSPCYQEARRANIQIEYDLLKAFFSERIHLEHPKGEPETHNCAVVARFKDTILPSGEDNSVFIHELEVTNSTDTSVPQKHLVIIHGYMAALGYFIKNIEEIALAYPNLVVHLIDMPGFGNSSRPAFPKELLSLPSNKSTLDEIQQVIGVENWFIDKFEEWRIQRDIAKFDLIGHSMGAYLSSCYLLKYNKTKSGNLVDKFVLVSPMGTESSDISLINHKELQFNHHDVASNPLGEIFESQNFLNQDSHNEELIQLWESLGKPKFPRNIFLRTLWNNNVSPFQVLQAFGPMYLKLLSFWSYQRFQNVTSTGSLDEPSEDRDNADHIMKLHNYSFSIFNQYQGSGELAITKLINHEIVPRLPLCDRGFVEFLCDNKIQTLWMYGTKDWMNTKGGEYCVKKLSELEGRENNIDEVSNAGHHLYLDNPKEFNSKVITFLFG